MYGRIVYDPGVVREKTHTHQDLTTHKVVAGGRGSVTDGLCSDELVVGAAPGCVRAEILLLCTDKQEKKKPKLV